MHGRLLVTLRHDNSSKTFLFDEKVETQLWLSLSAEHDPRRAVARMHMEKRNPMVVPLGGVSITRDGMAMGEVEVEWNAPTVVSLHKEGDEQAYVLFTRPVEPGVGRYERVALAPGTSSLAIGRSASNDLRYNNPFVSGKHARLSYDHGVFVVEDLGSGNGTLVNGVPLAPLQPRWLEASDVVQVLDLTFMVGNGFVSINHPRGLSVNGTVLRRLVSNHAGEDEPIPSTDGLKEEPARFYPAPRLARTVRSRVMQVEAPPHQQDAGQGASAANLGASMLMGVSSLAMLVPSVMAMGNGANWLSILPSAAMSVSMLGGAVVLPLVTRAQESRRSEAEEARRRHLYVSYLDELENELAYEAEQQAQVLRMNRMGMAEIAKRVDTRSPLLMNRTSLHDDFLELRVGVGDQELRADVSWPEKGLSMQEDVLFDKLEEVEKRVPCLRDVPMAFDMATHNVAGILGERRLAWEFLRGVLLQVCALYSYTEVKILMIAHEGEREEWGFLSSLGHVHDNLGIGRYVVLTPEGMAEKDRLIDQAIATRKGWKAGSEGQGAYYVVVCANRDLCGRSQGVRKLLGIGENRGFSLIYLGRHLYDLPRECGYLICLGNTGDELLVGMSHEDSRIQAGSSRHGEACMFERSDVLGTLAYFTPDILVSREQAWSFSHGLARMRLDAPEQRTELPHALGFLQMFKVGNVDQLNIGRSWKQNDASRTLQAPLGVDARGELVMLDLHERRHGPHGLIAGMTGSGKSEFIVSYVLSLCVTYAPDEVSFVLIDYKGGGLARTFDNERYRLPHLSGTITNLDGDGIRRSLASVRSELKRRQALLNKARSITGEAAMDVYSYISLYRQGILEDPMPHLFIIADEFAELKQQEPEFMDELVSAARIGRSLGVHLVLATQRPTGVVDEQIWSNARFKVALKVADAADSKEIIRRDDAAAITRPGHFFLLVGYGESFVEGQAAYAGLPYVPKDRFEPQRDETVELLDQEGNVLASLREPPKITEGSKSEILAVLDQIGRSAQLADKHAQALWLDPLPTVVTLDAIANTAPLVHGDGLPCTIGLVDDPDEQRQFRYDLDLAEVGNVVLYGSHGSGVEDMLVAMMLMLARSRAADRLWIYCADLGSGSLTALKDLPHVGGVVSMDEGERLAALFGMLEAELGRRRELLAPFGGSLAEYDRSGESPLARIVVALVNLATLQELYPALEDRLVALARDAVRFGMHFVMTAATANAVRMRLRPSIGMDIPTVLNDSTEYASILGQNPRFVPAACERRGLLRLGSELFEFQGVCVAADHAMTRVVIAKDAENMARETDVRPPKVPRLPRHVYATDMEAAEAAVHFPVGFSKRDLHPVFFDLRSTSALLVLGNDSEALTRYVRGAKETLMREPFLSVRFIDVLHALQGEADEHVLTASQDVLDLLDGLWQASVEVDVLVVVDIARTLDALGAEGGRLLSDVLVKAFESKGMSVVLTSEMWRTRSLYADWYQAALASECGVWVGGGFCDQTALRFSRLLPEYRQPADATDGFMVSRGSVECVRLVEPSEGTMNEGGGIEHEE